MNLNQATRAPDSLGFAQAAWKRWPDSQAVAQGLARAMQAAGQDQDVVPFLQARIKQWPDIPEFRKALADSYDRLGQPVESRQAMADYYEQTGALPPAGMGRAQ